jgi:tRNA pseudouridine55 synthase
VTNEQDMNQQSGKTAAVLPSAALQRQSLAALQPTPRLAVSGVLLIDKPPGMTSFAAVSRVRNRLHLAKVGHCGTLDPFATGLLILCLNQATRIVDQLLVQDKAYRCTLHLGVETDTLDHTGKVLRHYAGALPDEGDVRRVLTDFCGSHVQQVPKYAAVKVQGRRLYAWTRDGVEVEPPRREVHIHRLELLGYQWPEAQLEVRCSKGTYIRQLASDIGEILGCGAHLNQLRRLASGLFHIHEAIHLDDLEALGENSSWREKLIPLSSALNHLPAITVTHPQVLAALQDGHLDPAWEVQHQQGLLPDRPGAVRLVSEHDQLLALWWPQAPEGERRVRIFHRR